MIVRVDNRVIKLCDASMRAKNPSFKLLWLEKALELNRSYMSN